MDTTRADIDRIFEAYDQNKNGFIDYEELRELLIDLGKDCEYAEHDNPEQAFEEYVQLIWRKYDTNWDSFVS